jgi:hypothetical protein
LLRLETLGTRFAGEALSAYARKTGLPVVHNEKQLWLAICRKVHALAALPALEAEFSRAWSSQAKLVVPNIDPEFRAEETWAPALAVCVLQSMTESMDSKDTALSALELYDRLRLREPLARAFSAGGEITEDGWRAAARVRLAFLSQSLASTPSTSSAAFAGLPRALWENEDARWLLNVHEATGDWYFNKELHEQILWWTQLPDLLQLAAPDEKKARAGKPLKAIESAVESAIEEAEEAGFRPSKEKEVVVKPVEQEKGALTT